MKKKGLLVGVSALAIAGLSTALTSCGKTATYTVKFYDGTTEYDSKTVTSGYNVEVPVAPTSDGKIFNGWYSDEALTTPFDFGSIVEKDTQVYAAWVNRYSVTFKDGDSVLKTEKVTSGQNVQLPETPTKTDRAFNGWYLDKSFKQPYDFGSIVTGDVTLYASFVSATDPKTEFRATYMVDGVVVESALTFKQKVEELPEIQVPAGKEFAGWWVSDYQDSSKLTYQFDINKALTQDVILFAVFKDANKPLVTVEDKKISWDNKGVGKEYSVNIKNADSSEAEVIYSRTVSTTYLDYDFNNLPAGNYAVEVICGDYSTTAYVSNKTLDRVNIYVDDFEVSWNKVSGATNYKLTIDNGVKGKTVTVDLGDENTYSFDTVQMQANGIKFKVEAQAEDMLSSVKEYTLTRVLNKVSNLKVDSANDKLSWDDAGAEKYKVQISANGKTNTYYVSDNQFDLDNFTGEITYSVSQYEDGYYSYVESGTYTKALLSNPKNLTLADDGYKVVWDEVPGATKYVVRVGNASKEVQTNSYVLTEEEKANLTSLTVQAIAQEATNNSAQVELEFATAQVTWVEFYQGILSWSPVLGATKYALVIDDNEAILVEGTSYQLDVEAGHHTYKVAVVKADGTYDETKAQTHENTVYNLIFNTNGGEEIAKVAYEVGSEIDLPMAVLPGYTFTGWYKTEGNYVTDEFTDLVFSAQEDVTIYAGWLGNNYKVTLDYGKYATEEGTKEFEMTFGNVYSLPVPKSNDPLKVFGGWYSREDGIGERYTDETGNSLNKWRDLSDTTVYAGWLNVFEFEEIDAGNAYSVKKGTGISLIKTVTIPSMYNGKPVTTVEASAFDGCSNLIEINIPNTVTLVNIGAEGPAAAGNCFKGCTKLERVNVYEVEGVIEEDVVYSSVDGVLLRRNNGEVELAYFPYYTKSGTYRVPSNVTSIPQYAFKSCSKLETIIVPSSVKFVGEQAFASCSNLKEIRFLVDDEITDERTLELGEKVFYSNSILETLTLPSYVTNFDPGIIEYCSSLAYINIVGEYENANYASIDGVIVNKAKTEIIFCPRGRTGDYETPVNVDTIKAKAFASCNKLTSLVISGQVKLIEEEAFKSCYGLESLVFEGTATDVRLSIETNAFNGCSKITQVVLPENLISLKEASFGNMTNLTKVTVESSSENLDFETNAFGYLDKSNILGNYKFTVTDLVIGKNAGVFAISGVFGSKLENVDVEEGNPNYTSVDGVLYDKEITAVIYYPSGRSGSYTLPTTIKTIGARVFENTAEMNEIVFPATVESIGESAFQGCSKLERVVFEQGETPLTIGDAAFKSCSSLIEINLPNRLTAISNSMLFGCSKLTSIVVPDTIKFIGDEAFRNCSKLTTITLPSSLEEIEETEGSNAGTASLNTGVRIHAFDYCASLTSISISENNKNFKTIDGILYKVIYDNENVKGLDLIICPQGKEGEIVVAENVINVTAYSFYDTDLVTKVVFSDNSNGITFNTKVFYTCNKLEEVVLPTGMVNLPENLFYSCQKLASVEIPNTVIKLSGAAFYDCTSLASITFEEGGTEGLEIEKGTKGTSGTVYQGMFYKNKNIKTLILPERTTNIGDYAFASYASGYGYTSGDYSCSLETVVIPSTVKSIGVYAFYGCNIKNLTFTDGETELTIGDRAFSKTLLEDIVLPGRLKTVADYAFTSLTSLKNITFSEKIEKIGTGTFSSCSNLTSIILPNSLKEIGTSAFSSCTKLESVNFPNGSSLETIGSKAFNSCSNLTSIIIPKTVKTIKDQAFISCKSLESVTFEGDNTEEGASISSIGYQAFQACSSLESFRFPYCGKDSDDKYNTIKFEKNGSVLNLFEGCKKLTEVYLSEAINDILDLFNKAPSITNVIIAENNESFKTAEGKPIILTHDGKSIEYIYGSLDDIEVPEGVETLGSYLFDTQTEITSISLPVSLKTIGQYAFRNCVNLKTITFATGCVLSEIGEGAFYNCRSLKSITIPNEVTKIAKNTFQACLLLTEVKLPSELNEIEQYAFIQAKSLETVVLPNSLKKINQYAFSYSYIKNLTLPASVNELGQNAFKHADYLEYLRIEGDNLDQIPNNCFEYCISLKKVEFGDNAKITKIGSSAFSNCTSLVSFTVPKSVKAMLSITTDISKATESSGSGNIFYNCTSLETVIFEEGSQLSNIGTYAFQNCTSLKNISLPNSLTILGNYAFKGCTSLEEISIECPNLRSIPAYCFDGCSNLVNVTFGEVSFSRIGTYAFQNCTSLKSIIIPKTVNGFGDYTTNNIQASTSSCTFTGCTSLESVIFEEGSKLAKVGQKVFQNCTSLKEIVLPSTLTVIGNYMFDGCTSLTSVVLSTNLTYLPQYMFQNCTSLIEIEIPAKVKNMGGTSATATINASSASSTFKGCTNLERVVLANGSQLAKIGASAFEGCVKLQSIDISKLTVIANKAFLDCKQLKSANAPLCSTLGTNVFQNCENLESANIQNLTAIPNNTFDGCSSLVSVTINTSKNTTLGTYVFNGCTSLTTIDLSKVTSIGTYAFSDCESLQSVSLPIATSIGTYAFRGCSSLESVDAPNLQTIGQGAFEYTSLKKFSIASTVTTINGGAFNTLSNLELTNASENYMVYENIALIKKIDGTIISVFNIPENFEIVLPDDAKAINSCAFMDTDNLKKITLNENITVIPASCFFSCSNLEEIVLGSKVTEIGKEAFKYCSKLTSITLPEGLVEIGNTAFQGCNSLKSIVLPNTVTTLGNSVFNGIDVEEVTLSSGLTTIGTYVFADCSKLKTVIIPEGVQTLGSYMFDNCISLERVVLPGSLSGKITTTTTGYYSFRGCTALKSVKFEEGNKIVPKYMFQNCTSLEEVVFADSIENIGDYAFENTALLSIILPESLKTFGPYAFRNCTSLVQVTFNESLTKIGNYAFTGCEKLENVVLPKLLEETGTYTFQNCASLESIELPSTLKTIGTYVFDGTNIKSIVFPDTLTKIDGYAFRGTKLEEVIFPDSLTFIGTYAFSSCPDLTTVTFGKNKYTIGNYAFVECPVLENITFPEGFIFNSGTTANYAFANNLAIKSVVFPTTAIYVPEYILSGCTNLEEVTIPEGIEQIYYGAFENCSKLSNVILPETLTKIWYMAFANCTSIEELLIPVSCVVGVNEDKSAFNGWTSEQKVITTLSLHDVLGLWGVTIYTSLYGCYRYDDFTDATFVYDYVVETDQD